MRGTRAALFTLALLLGCRERAETLASGLSPASTPAPTVHGARVHTRELLSPVWHVDRIYKSMKGPQVTEDVALAPGGDVELLWIVGFEAVMVAADGVTPASQEFMCHTNLDVEPVAHMTLFPGKKRLSGRLFTLSQGQERIDLPAGFGLPVLSSEIVQLNTQVLNLNMREGEVTVRHRVMVRFVRDAELAAPLQALYPAGAYGLKLLRGEDGRHGVDASAGEHGPSCLPGEAAAEGEYDDGKGRAFTGHWVVKPGREVNRTRVTDILELPFDTTLHYVAVHLHPFAESLELRDLTTGTTVYRATTRQAERGIGLAHVDFYASAAGLPLYRGHEYEVVSVYDNTSGEDQDSMAVLNLYLLDREFEKPDLAKVRAELGDERPTPTAAPRPM
jgi:hypothetical protein